MDVLNGLGGAEREGLLHVTGVGEADIGQDNSLHGLYDLCDKELLSGAAWAASAYHRTYLLVQGNDSVVHKHLGRSQGDSRGDQKPGVAVPGPKTA